MRYNHWYCYSRVWFALSGMCCLFLLLSIALLCQELYLYVPLKWIIRPHCDYTVADATLHVCVFHSYFSSRLGIGPDGKPLPRPNPKKLYPRLYKTLLVQADGSTYTIGHRFPHRILALPIDPNSLSAEEKAERLKKRRQQEAPVYVDEEDEFDDEWSQSTYRELIDRWHGIGYLFMPVLNVVWCVEETGFMLCAFGMWVSPIAFSQRLSMILWWCCSQN